MVGVQNFFSEKGQRIRRMSATLFLSEAPLLELKNSLPSLFGEKKLRVVVIRGKKLLAVVIRGKKLLAVVIRGKTACRRY
jgi:hypothetical protein